MTTYRIGFKYTPVIDGHYYSGINSFVIGMPSAGMDIDITEEVIVALSGYHEATQ
jgi:hypothetical protein